jgi:hypothetical protein
MTEKSEATHGEVDGGRALLGAFFLASGGALVFYILSGVSLGGTFALMVAGAVAGVVAVRRRLAPERRAELDRRLRAGLAAGVAGLAAYDGTRWAFVHLARYRFKPFDVFSIFGQALAGRALLGPHHAIWWIDVAGVAFHVTNGLGFATAYTIWMGRRGTVAGVVFALALNMAMILLYPGWLKIRLLGEFVQVAMLGHVAYGAAVGATARAVLRRSERMAGVATA